MLLLQVQAGVLALERRAADAASNTARGDWGSTSSQHEPAVSQQDLAEMQQAVAKMHDKYGALLKGFLTGLPAAANEVRAGRCPAAAATVPGLIFECNWEPCCANSRPHT